MTSLHEIKKKIWQNLKAHRGWWAIYNITYTFHYIKCGCDFFFFLFFVSISFTLTLSCLYSLWRTFLCVFFSPSSHRIRKGGKTTTFRVPDAKCIRNLYLPLLLAWYFLKLPSKSPIGQQRSFCLFFSLSDFLKKLWGSIKSHSKQNLNTSSLSIYFSFFLI